MFLLSGRLMLLMRLQEESSLRILSSRLAGNLVLKPRSFLVQGYSLIIPQILRSLSVRMVVRMRLIRSYSLSIKEIYYQSILNAVSLMALLQCGDLEDRLENSGSYTQKKFTTAHSSTDRRDNFFFKVDSDLSKEEGFGQCGLPPKKPLCYLADLNDCREFSEILEKEFSHQQRDIEWNELQGFVSVLLKDIPSSYFRYLYRENVKDVKYLPLLKDILRTLQWVYKIKEPRFKAAISGLQFALFDFYAKVMKLSLTSFIFGDKAAQQSKYSFYTISYEESIEAMITNALEFLPLTPYIKVKFIDSIISLLDLLTALEDRANGKVKGYIIDANASWRSESFSLFCKEISSQKYQKVYKKIMYVEQPYPLEMSEQEENKWKQLKLTSSIKILVDESFSSYQQIPVCVEFGHGINIKSEKAGGPISCVRAGLQARKYGLEVVLGTMLSTNLGCNQTYSLNPLTTWLDVDGCLLIDSPVLQGGFSWDGQEGLKPPKDHFFGIQINASDIKLMK